MKGETIIVIGGLAAVAYVLRNEVKQALQSFTAPTEGGGGGGSGSGATDTSGWNPNQPMLPGGAYRYGFYDPNRTAASEVTADSPFRSSRTGGGLDILPARPGGDTAGLPGTSTSTGDTGSAPSSGGFGGSFGEMMVAGAGLAAGSLLLEKATGGLTKIANLARGRVVPSQAAENIAARTAASDAARAAETKAAQKVETSVASKLVGTEAKAATGVAGRAAGAIGGAARLAGTAALLGTAGTEVGLAIGNSSLGQKIGSAVRSVAPASVVSGLERLGGAAVKTFSISNIFKK